MNFNQKQERLAAIKLRYVFFPTTCNLCGKKYVKEKMWKVLRYGINKTSHEWHYCLQCMNSAEDVLNEVDTDESIFGLANIDNFPCSSKKDCTRIFAARKKVSRPLQKD